MVIGILTVTCMHKWVSVGGEHLRCRLLRGSYCLSKAAGVQCLHSIESISKGPAKDVNAIHRVAHEGRDVSLDLFCQSIVTQQNILKFATRFISRFLSEKFIRLQFIQMILVMSSIL